MKQKCLIMPVAYTEDIRNANQEVAKLIEAGWTVKSMATSKNVIMVLLEKE